MADQTIAIKNGPGKQALSAGFFSGSVSGGRRIPVTFTLETDQTIKFFLTQMSWEDGSGQSWNFEGFVKGSGINERVSGYYRSDTRYGYIKLPSNMEHVVWIPWIRN